jgi:hypothetical protein
MQPAGKGLLQSAQESYLLMTNKRYSFHSICDKVFRSIDEAMGGVIDYSKRTGSRLGNQHLLTQ